MADWREDLLQHVARKNPTEGETFAGIADVVREAGFEYCSIGIRRPGIDEQPEEMWWSTYPERWQRYYVAHDFLKLDPVINGALGSHLPVVWDSRHTSTEHAFWEAASEHGVHHGWTLGLRGARGEVAVVSLARSSDPVSEAELERDEARWLWLSHTAIDALTRQGLPDAASAARLSVRECEILRWALAGKTSAETGTILGISPRTVNFHVAEILQKLNVVNRTQAVAKALILGIID